MQEWLSRLEEFIDLSFWIHFIEQFKDYGAVAPILLALLESIIPVLPLLVIISFNVGVYGPIEGFVYSWLGTALGSILMFLLYRHLIKRFISDLIVKREKTARLHDWLSHHKPITLFMLSALPFTPSSLINIAYGLSDFPQKTYITTIVAAKAIMVLTMTFFGHSLVQIAEQPWFLVISGFSLLGLYFLSKHLSDKYLSNQSL